MPEDWAEWRKAAGIDREVRRYPRARVTRIKLGYRATLTSVVGVRGLRTPTSREGFEVPRRRTVLLAMENTPSQDSRPSIPVSTERADLKAQPHGPAQAEVVAAMAHLVSIADWYVNGGSAQSDPNAYRLVGLLVGETLRHLDEARWGWLDFEVTRAVWVASNRYPEPKLTVAALAKWRADTAKTLQRALCRLGPHYKTPVAPEAPDAEGDAEPVPADRRAVAERTLEMRVERAMKHFDKLRAKRKKSGIWENLAMAVSTEFGTASVTAQREMQVDVLPESIGADCSVRPRSVPEWLSTELGSGAVRFRRDLKKPEKGKGYRAKPKQSAYGHSTLMLDGILTGELLQTKPRSSGR